LLNLQKANPEQRDKLIDDLGSLFDETELEPPRTNKTNDGEKMKQDLVKARQLLSSGMDQVK
jgi:hypothetical protein